LARQHEVGGFREGLEAGQFDGVETHGRGTKGGECGEWAMLPEP
jgi:hypothetical protein